MDPQTVGPQTDAMDHVVLVVPPQIDQFDAVVRGGPGELGVVAQKIVQAGDDRQAAGDRFQKDRPPVQGDLAAGRGDAQQKRVGLR